MLNESQTNTNFLKVLDSDHGRHTILFALEGDVEPVTATIITALVAGATAAAKDVATAAVKDAYAALKRVISDRYAKTGPFVDAVVADPTSQPEQQMLAKQLDQACVANDDDLKARAQQLLDAVEKLRHEPKASALFDFEGLLKARNFELEDIRTIGAVLRVKGDAVFAEDFKAKGIYQLPSQPEKN
jgi:hypothetical protein